MNGRSLLISLGASLPEDEAMVDIVESDFELLLCQAPALVRLHLVHDRLTVLGPGQQHRSPTLHTQPNHQDLSERRQPVHATCRVGMQAGPCAHAIHQHVVQLVVEVDKPEGEVWHAVQLHVPALFDLIFSLGI